MMHETQEQRRKRSTARLLGLLPQPGWWWLRCDDDGIEICYDDNDLLCTMTGAK